MRRALLLVLGLGSATFVSFVLFPGHTYLLGDTQLYLPMLERLDAPGYLSRDLVATHAHLRYTVYDEVTLFLHNISGISFRTALLAQQVTFRAAGVLGAFLLGRSAGLSDLFAFVIATLPNLIGTLPGPGISLLEPLPCGFALDLVLLSMGLLSRGRPLVAGLAGGFALLYDVPIALPYWALIAAVGWFDRSLRPLCRAALTVLLVFILLLANLAQLQPGVVEPQPFLTRLSDRTAAIQRYSGSSAWVSLWAGREIWNYLAIWVCGAWATSRIWNRFNGQMRWLFVLLPSLGIASVPVSYLLLEGLRWSAIPQIQPARELAFTVVASSLACGIAGVTAARDRKLTEALAWLTVLFALPLQSRILDLLSIANIAHFAELIFSITLAAILVWLVLQFGRTKLTSVVLVLPLLAMLAGTATRWLRHVPNFNNTSIDEIADWAENNTWGSSMFLFPDAGRALYPGRFRAESRRPLWVDWESGSLSNYFESFADDWYERWKATMDQPFSPAHLQGMLSLPLDYLVLKQTNRLAAVKPVFVNHDFLVYDARDLRQTLARSHFPDTVRSEPRTE